LLETWQAQLETSGRWGRCSVFAQALCGCGLANQTARTGRSALL